MKSAASPSIPSNRDQHIGYIDGLRGSAALVVLIHHMWLEAGLPIYPFGHYAVGLFITLSGFSLMLPVIRSDGVLPGGAIPFFKRRARRILPPYYAAVAFALVLIWLFLGNQTADHYDPSYNVNLIDIVTHLFLVHDILPATALQISGPFWSIAVEWRIYFLFPVLVIMARHWGLFKTILAAFITSVGLTFLFLQTPINMETNGVSPQYLTLFTLGMLAATIVFSDKPIFANLRVKVPWSILAVVLAGVLLALLKVKPWNNSRLPHYITDYVVGIWSLGLLIATSNSSSWLHRIFAWRPLAFAGTFAYSIYLIHVPLVRLLWQYAVLPLNLSSKMQFALLVLVGSPIILVICYLFFFIAERPFLRRRKAETAHSAVMPETRPVSGGN